MTTNSKLRSAVRFALGTGSGLLAAMAVTPGAMAQDNSAEVLEEITVTGSRIKRADLDSASPVTVIDRDAILSTGITDVGNLIQRMPSMSGSPIGTTTNNGGNGSVLVDLRGLGTDRTLTLVNGKRVVDGGDYQTIPAAMIERVEVLKDGASAVYGADAVAGVVNIITRTDFDGIDVTLQTADFFDMKSGAQQSASIIAGKSWSEGNFVFGAEYVKQDEAYQSDAPWAYFQDSYYIYPEGCEKQLTQPYPTGCYPIGSSRIPESRLQFVSNGRFMVETPGAVMTPHDGRTYNYAPVNYIQTPYERYNLFFESNFDLTDDVRFSAAIRGNFRESAQELAPQPYNSPTDPAYNGVFNGTAYSGISPDNFYLRQAIDRYNAANGTALIYEPVRDARRRMVETTRRFTQDITQVQANFGITGSFNEIDWDFSYNTGRRSRIDNDFGQFYGPALSNAMGPSADLNNDGTPECYQDITDPNSVIAGCVPFNFFGGPGSVTQSMLDYVGIDLVDSFVTRMDEVGFGITGTAFELPGGEFGWAVGAGYLGQEFTYSPDATKQQDAVTGNTGAGTKGSLYAGNYYAEFLAPLYDNGNQSFDVKGGVRYDDYNIFGGDTTWQIGLEFQAVESLKMRATAGTVFRAPTISDLFAGQVDSFPTYSDPCIPGPGQALPPGCAQVGVQLDSQLLARVGGNPNLKPETGDTFTAGFVWTPDFNDQDLSLTVDYWDTQLEDGISSLGVQFILEDCYVRQNASSCSLITRRSDYSIAQVLDGNLNVAEQGANGIDTEVRYSFDTEFGQFETALLWSHLLERTKKASPIATEEDLSGRYTDPTAEDGGAYATDKINYSIQWYKDNFSIGYLGEYISELDADTFCNCDSDGDPSNNTADGSYIQKIDSRLYHDIVATYSFPDSGTEIAAGITNITDEEPPYIEVGFNATTDPATYRLFGMGYYLRLTQSFE